MIEIQFPENRVMKTMKISLMSKVGMILVETCHLTARVRTGEKS